MYKVLSTLVQFVYALTIMNCVKTLSIYSSFQTLHFMLNGALHNLMFFIYVKQRFECNAGDNVDKRPSVKLTRVLQIFLHATCRILE